MKPTKKHIEAIKEVANGYIDAKEVKDKTVKQIWCSIRLDENDFCKICKSTDRNCHKCLIEKSCMNDDWRSLNEGIGTIKMLNKRGEELKKLLTKYTK